MPPWQTSRNWWRPPAESRPVRGRGGASEGLYPGRFLVHAPAMKRILTLFLAGCLSSCSAAEGDLPRETAKAAMEAYQSGDYEKTIALTEGIAAESPWKQVRAMALQRRGEARFYEGDIQGAIADFDAHLAYYPHRDPEHWQRGLCYYYAGEFAKGKAQFERHRQVNPEDVENAVWHFLCAVKAPGGNVESARREFIPVQNDSRVPMKEIHALFAGQGTAEAVLEAAKENGDGVLDERERNRLCYAHLYLGLYYEALGEAERSAEHIRRAAFDYPMDHYMGRTAQVHARLRGIDGAK